MPDIVLAAEAAIQAFRAVWRQEADMPYGPARVDDYVSEHSTGQQRADELAALKAADEEAERLNVDLIRRALAAAAPVIAAQERERIRQLAIKHNAQCHHADGSGGSFADLLDGDTHRG